MSDIKDSVNIYEKCRDHQFEKNTTCKKRGNMRSHCKEIQPIKQDGIKKEQRFEKEYYLVIDFEANCSSKDMRDHEIIEFPAVLVNATTGITVAEFRSFVKMIKHKHLSEFIKELTHITNEQVYSGYDWGTCLIEFEKWCHQQGITYQNTTVVTCGNWDLQIMLHNELKISKTKLTKYLNNLFGCWTNVKVYFAECTNTKQCGMERMLQYLGIKLVGHHHSGLDDSRNIAKICHALTRMGCDITTPTDIRESKFWYPEHHLSWKRKNDGDIIKC